jgi:hypothetical protein
MFILFDGKIFNANAIQVINCVVQETEEGAQQFGITIDDKAHEWFQDRKQRDNRFKKIADFLGCTANTWGDNCG